jgi:hypothetical protein
MTAGLRNYREGLMGETTLHCGLPRPTWGKQMAIKRIREASPLWVWLAVALLAFGAIAYVTALSVIEYLMAAAG